MKEPIETLLRANAAVYDRVRTLSPVGMTERALKERILSVYRETLGTFTFCGDIVTGPRSAVGEGDATDRVIQPGDAILLDLLPYHNGTCCDTTRTFFAGSVSAHQRDIYALVRRALEEGASCLRPGVRASEVYAAVRDRLRPYEDTFFHHAGHRITGRRLVQPQFLPDRQTRLRVGDIVTLEPGLYIGDSFGIRLENNFRITEDGCECLFSYPLTIENFITR